MTADCALSVSFEPRQAIKRILGVGATDLFAETPLVAALRAGTPREQLSSGVSRELEIATLIAFHDVAFTDAQIVWLQNPCMRLVQDQPLLLTNGLVALALSRPELKGQLELETPAGRRGLLNWWMLQGREETLMTPMLVPNCYQEPSPFIEQDQPLLITRGMHALALTLPELKTSIDVCSAVGRRLFVQWWMNEGCRRTSIAGLGACGNWNEASPLLDSGSSVTRGLHALWLSREDLQQAFDIATIEGRRALLDWYSNYGECLLERIMPNETGASDGCADEFLPPLFPGVNILGYGRGEFGIGEDVRMAFSACEAAGIKACIPRLPLRIGARQSDMSVISAETDAPIYGTNLICLPFFETLRLLGKTREAVLDRRYNIAFWQWELPRFPQVMTCALDLVDEVWASSEFTASTMREATEKPVFLMPIVVCLPEKCGQWRRADFGLPEDDFVFLTVLDGASSLKRKNPLAVVRAFLNAFPRDRRVHLVVKAMNVNSTQEDWRRVREYASEDQRITLIAETMTKDKLLGLQSICDCFVSLHRSEGFGRNIAEAMLLGKPVVVSDYSGNRDFSRPETAFLVPGELVPLEEGDYPFWEEQSWFEPDADSAAAALSQCFERQDLRLSRGEAGQAWIRENYSAARVGQVYRDRLDALERKWRKPA